MYKKNYRPAIFPCILYSIYKINNLSTNIYKDFAYNTAFFLGFDYILFLFSIGINIDGKLMFHNNNFYLDLEIGEKS
jgi:hypothetical protein